MGHSNDVNISRSISDQRVTQGGDGILEKTAQAEPKRSPSGSLACCYGCIGRGPEHEKLCTAFLVGVQ